MKVTEIKGNLITLAENGEFDVIVQGNNCFCVQGAGLAPQMVKAFDTDKFPMERDSYKGDINKLGTIDYQIYPTNEVGKNFLTRYDKTMKKGLFKMLNKFAEEKDDKIEGVFIVNAYTQYEFGKNHSNGTETPVDYDAVTMVMRKINHKFKGKHIGIPYLIGCGLAGGDTGRVLGIIEEELKDMKVTLVKLPNYEER